MPTYRRAKQDMKELQTAKYNIEQFYKKEEQDRQAEKQKTEEKTIWQHHLYPVHYSVGIDNHYYAYFFENHGFNDYNIVEKFEI